MINPALGIPLGYISSAQVASQFVSLGTNLVPRMQVRERLGCVSTPSYALISSVRKLWHTTKNETTVFSKKVSSLDKQGNRVLCDSAGMAGQSLHDFYLSLLLTLGSNVHSQFSRDLEKMVDRVVVVESVQ